MWQIDEVLLLLHDGKWHNLREITRKTSLNEITVRIIVNFLSAHGFIKSDEKGWKVKLHPTTRAFINEIQCIEEEDMRALRVR